MIYFICKSKEEELKKKGDFYGSYEKFVNCD